jgi:hypothetical protein
MALSITYNLNVKKLTTVSIRNVYVYQYKNTKQMRTLVEVTITIHYLLLIKKLSKIFNTVRQSQIPTTCRKIS